MKTYLLLALMLVLGACSHGKGKDHGCTSCKDDKKEVKASAVEYDGNCAMGLCLKGAKVKCDPTITAAHKGKTYCFSTETAREKFMKNADGNAKKAQSTWENINRAPHKT